MAGFREPPAPDPAPVELVFPPQPTGDRRSDAALLEAWSAARWRWHTQHAAMGRSELGDHQEHLRARHSARLFRLAFLGELDPRQGIPLPGCWVRRWDERPAWLERFENNPGNLHSRAVLRDLDAGTRPSRTRTAPPPHMLARSAGARPGAGSNRPDPGTI